MIRKINWGNWSQHHSTLIFTIHTHNRLTALWILSVTARASRYQKKHSPTLTYCGHQSSLIWFIHLLRSMASPLFNPRAWQSFLTISLQVFFCLLLGLAPSTSYSIHLFTQSLSSFRNTCPYHHFYHLCHYSITINCDWEALNAVITIIKGAMDLESAVRLRLKKWRSQGNKYCFDPFSVTTLTVGDSSLQWFDIVDSATGQNLCLNSCRECTGRIPELLIQKCHTNG